MNLESLPVDVLAQIFNTENSHLVIGLWKCGNRCLNGKFQRGAVTTMVITHEERDSTSRWPRCLKEFKLERLIVRSPNHTLCTTSTLRSELKQIHGGLKELEILNPAAMEVFFAERQLTPSTPKWTIASPDPSKTKDPVAGQRNERDAWDLNATWPQLERLSIFSNNHLRGPTYASSIFSLLPRSLTYLNMPLRRPRSDVSDVCCLQELPPLLKTLKVEHYEIETAEIELLPSSITDVGRSLDESATYTLFHDCSLLPNLAIFPYLEEPEANSFLMNAGFDDGSPWPDNIKFMHFEYLRTDTIYGGSPLPRGLEELILSQTDSPYDVDQETISKLPPALRKLTLDRADWDKIHAVEWPKSLETLIVTCSTPPHSLHKFPRYLTALNVQLQSEDGASDNDANEDKVTLIRPLSTSDSLLWSTLEQEMRDKDFYGGSAATYKEAVRNGFLFGLPLMLRSLKLAFDQEDCLEGLVLPPRITELSLSCETQVNWPKFVQLLPPSLTWLTVITATFERFDCLKHLRRLTLIQSSRQSANCPSSFHLPPQLEELKVRADCSFSLEVIQDLPRHLTRLNMKGKRTNFNGPWVHLLPPSLQHLAIFDLKISGSELHRLPPMLRSLKAPFQNVTLDTLLQVPRGLSRLTVLSCESKDSDYLLYRHMDVIVAAYQPFYVIFEDSFSGELSTLSHASQSDLDADIDPRTLRRIQDSMTPKKA